MNKIVAVFGTRPEAIKMCPLVKELRQRNGEDTIVCVSGQHRQMLDSVMDSFGVRADYNLRAMKKGQTLFGLTERILSGARAVLAESKPDIVLVHGDTATAFASALAAFYMKIPVGHIEAGLRTYNTASPYPEEFFRRAISVIAKYHFAPTKEAQQNLIREGIDEGSVFLTGNTVIDALVLNVKDDYSHSLITWAADSRLVVLTAHRRESLGKPLGNMLRAVRRAVEKVPDLKVVYPVHMNPEVRAVAEVELCGCERIRITEPLGVYDFHNILAKSYIVLTDSGGLQEEAGFLGKPTLVMRSATERPEGIASGALRLVGTDEEGVYSSFIQLLENPHLYRKMASPTLAFGDGSASRRIADILLNKAK